ncbi:MAG: hypothetical protein Kow00108_22120 [Calditrichia bacterium]
MKRLSILFIILGVFLPSLIQAQLFSWQQPSARITAMGGGMTAIVNDQWSGFYNPAGFSQLEEKRVAVSYYNLYNLSFLKSVFLTTAIPFDQKVGTFALSYGQFGVDYQGEQMNSESNLMLSYGRYIFKDFNSSLAFGANLKLLHWSLGESEMLGDLGSATTMGLDIGFQASLFQRTWFGAYLTNINSPKFGKTMKQDLLKKLVVGLAYQPYSGVITTFDIKKDFDARLTQYWGGAEFNVNKYLDLRSGFKLNPNQFSFGLGFHYKLLRIDYAVVTHPKLSETHQFGVALLW